MDIFVYFVYKTIMKVGNSSIVKTSVLALIDMSIELFLLFVPLIIRFTT